MKRLPILLCAIFLIVFAADVLSISCSQEGDINQNVIFADGTWQVEMEYNVYKNNPAGKNTFCQRVVDVQSTKGVKMFRVLATRDPKDIVSYVSEAGDKLPISSGNWSFGEWSTVFWLFGYDDSFPNVVNQGEKSGCLCYTSDVSNGIGTGMHEIYDDFGYSTGWQAGQAHPQPIPEFSTIGIIIAIAVIFVSFFFIRKNTNKKSQIGMALLIIFGLFFVSALGYVLFKDTTGDELVTYVVMEIDENGEKISTEVASDTGSAAFELVTTDDAEYRAIVPVEDGKTFFVDMSYS